MASIPVPVPPVAPVPEAEAKISPVGRLIGVLFSPKSTFEDIVRKPSWILPLAIMLIFGVAIAVGINQKMNWRTYMAEQIEKSPRGSSLSEEQKQAQIEGGAKFAPISTYVFGTLGPLIVVFVVAAIQMVSFNLLGGANTNYNTSLGIVAHSFVPTYLGNLLFLLVLFLKEPGTLNLDNPLATNVAALLPADIPKWLEALCKNIDVFTIWILVLLAIGFGATNPRKLKGFTPYAISFGVFGVYVLIRVGIAFAFS